MTIKEFEEQDKYCREFNVPEGPGCDKCPAKDKEHCADRLRGLSEKLILSRFKDKEISAEIERFYGISPFDQLSLIDGYIDFSE